MNVIQHRLVGQPQTAPVVDHEMAAMSTWYTLANHHSRLRDLEEDCRKLAVPPDDEAYGLNQKIIHSRLAALVEGPAFDDCRRYLGLVFSREGNR